MVRSGLAGGVEWAGYAPSDELKAALEDAKPAEVRTLRTVRLATDRGEADAKIEGPALWRRSEPGNSAELADAIAADIQEMERRMRRLLSFACAGAELAASLDGAGGRTGLLLVTGGSQTRIGSHRMYERLAKALAELGYPCLRYDRRGVGDSGGEDPGFRGAGRISPPPPPRFGGRAPAWSADHRLRPLRRRDRARLCSAPRPGLTA